MDKRMASGPIRKASIKETGEELSQEDWARFDAAVAQIRAERRVGLALAEYDHSLVRGPALPKAQMAQS